MRSIRPAQFVMACGSILIIAAAFVPFIVIFIPVGVIPFVNFACPYNVWWFGYPLLAVGAATLALPIFRPSIRSALFCIAFGFLVSIGAAIMLVICVWRRSDPFIPHAFLPMLAGGLCLLIGGVRMIETLKFREV